MFSRAQTVKSFRWFIRQNNELWYEIFKLQKQYFFKFREKYSNEKDLILLSLYAFEVACVVVHQTTLKGDSKNKDMNLGSVKSPVELRAKKIKKRKGSEKYEKLLNYKEVVLRLIDVEKLSYRKTAEYLYRYHNGFSVSHTLVGTFYKNMKGGTCDI